MTVKSSISLTDDQHAFAKTLVDSGRFPSVGAVLQQGIEMLREKMEDEALVSRITDFEGPVVAVIEGSCGWMVRGWLVGLNFPVPVPVGCREVGKRKREVGGGLRFAFDRGGCRGQRLVRR